MTTDTTRYAPMPEPRFTYQRQPAGSEPERVKAYEYDQLLAFADATHALRQEDPLSMSRVVDEQEDRPQADAEWLDHLESLVLSYGIESTICGRKNTPANEANVNRKFDALMAHAAQRPAAQPAPQDSREAFEAWAKQEGFSTKRIDSPDGVYANSGTHVAWNGWQAALASRAVPAPVSGEESQPRLTVRLSSFPESNGKRNWTALLVRVGQWDGLIGNCGGITIDRGEFWNRVAYEAERAKLLIGERDTEPDILDYGDDIKTPDEWPGEVRKAAHDAQWKGGV